MTAESSLWIILAFFVAVCDICISIHIQKTHMETSLCVLAMCNSYIVYLVSLETFTFMDISKQLASEMFGLTKW